MRRGSAKLLIGTYRMEGWPAEALERKYQKQEQRIHELDAADASMDLGAAGMTKMLFEFLFAKLCRAVITEGMLTAVFAALYMSGCEQTERTWQIVYATRRGRMVHREKLLAGFFYTMAVYVAPLGIFLAVFCPKLMENAFYFNNPLYRVSGIAYVELLAAGVVFLVGMCCSSYFFIIFADIVSKRRAGRTYDW